MMIYRYTNAHGRSRYGVCVQMAEHGAYVLADAWQPSDKVSAPASYAYVSFAPNPFVADGGKSHTELLPLDTPVPWQTPEIHAIVALMQAGTFDAWWATHEAEIVEKFIGGYR